jgi:catechol 2,3-dioxygenase-like lactoylglutathione lyase family enzyme
MLSDFPAYPVVPAADMARARRFYEETLGFVPIMDTPGGIAYRAKDSMLFVYPSEFAGTNKATAAGFTVSDIAATVAELKARGVRFEEYDMGDFKTVGGIAQTPGALGAWFKDTEGNIISLVQLDEPMA